MPTLIISEKNKILENTKKVKDFVFPVYIYENVLNEIKDLCKNNENEIFGYLIGLIYKWKEQMYIIIEDKLFIEGTFNSHKISFAQIEGTAGKYDKEFQKLKQNKKLKVFALSNTNSLHVEFLAKNIIDFRDYFNQVFYSYELGMIKPDPKIFLHVLEYINYKPSECIFIDDNRKNVKVAERIGMIGIQFRNETKFLEEINDLLNIS